MVTSNHQWPVQWYANGELQLEARLTDTQIKIISMLINQLNEENTNGN